MDLLAFSLIVAAGSFIAGLLGSLTGLGGGVVIVPMLTVLFGVDMHYAMGASLISVIATSSGAAAAYVREGFSNIRIGLFLELATTMGAMLGAFLSTRVPTSALAMILGLVLLYSALVRVKEHPAAAEQPNKLADRLKLFGTLPGPNGLEPYHARRVPLGFAVMGAAGTLSGLLGIGSGAIKVLGMDWAMGLPFKVSTTTSNFMIGVTAAASSGIYLRHGYVTPGLAVPVSLGVLGGSMLGAKLLVRQAPERLRLIFRLVIGALAVELIYNGLKGHI